MKSTYQYSLILLAGLIFQPSIAAVENQQVDTETTAPAEQAEDIKALEACLLAQLKISPAERTVAEIEAWCRQDLERKAISGKTELTPLDKRMLREVETAENPSVITPHKRNYILPVSVMDNINDAPYSNPLYAGQLDNLEVKFQLSFKAPLWKSIFIERDALLFGFTLQSYWQMYNSDISAPFRETNYQPEFYYAIVNDYKLGGWTNRVNMFGIEHQSNGQSQPQSRSWNRIFAQFVWENQRWVVSFRPWYRLPEDEKTDPNQPGGDDNPDIERYMGYFEAGTTYKWESHTLGLMFRNNLRSDNKGALQLDWTFPMGKRFKGYLQYFNGYGESLIDYNNSIERVGIGIVLTDLL